jgi:hypothetical protein
MMLCSNAVISQTIVNSEVKFCSHTNIQSWNICPVKSIKFELPVHTSQTGTRRNTPLTENQNL